MGKKKTKPAPIKRFWGIYTAVEAIIILIAGVLAIVVGCLIGGEGHEAHDFFQIVENWVLPLTVALFIIMDGVLRIVLAIRDPEGKNKEGESVLLVAGFEITAGVLIGIFQDIFIRLIMNAMGILLIVIGGLLILFAIFLIMQKKSKLFVPILQIVFSSVLVGIGAALLIMYYLGDATAREKIVLITIGIVFVLVAIGIAVVTMITMGKAKKEAKEEAPIIDMEKDAPRLEEDKIIDAEEVVEPAQIEQKEPEQAE